MPNLPNLLKKYFDNFFYFYNRLGYRIFIRLVLSFIVGLLDGMGLAMFLPLLQLVNGETTASSSTTNQGLLFVLKGMEWMHLKPTLVVVLGVIAFFFLLKATVQFINGQYDVILRRHFFVSMRNFMVEGLGKVSYGYFVKSDVGRIQNTMSSEVNRIAQAYTTYFDALQQLIMVIVYMVFAFFVEMKFAILISIGGFLINFIFKYFYKKTQESSMEYTREANIYQGLIIQFVNTFKYLKATGSLPVMVQKLKRQVRQIELYGYRIGSAGNLMGALREPLTIITVCLIIFLQVQVLGGSLGPILISLLFFYRALSSLMLMQTSVNQFLGVSGSIKNIKDFEKELNDNVENTGSKDVKDFTNKIELQNISFAYNKDAQILYGIDLVIEKNTTIAFVGESGSGKTTLVNIIVGLLPVTEGTMLIDSQSIDQINISSYQRKIGYITQEPIIYSDTIFNNITFWSEPTPENIERFNIAVKNASISDFLEMLPAGRDTLLGNNGINLSGGQRQRISIARELYKNVEILVLDEATSALDSETERAIQQNIDKLKGKYTVLIVAHRLSTIKNADKIILMNKGKFLGIGNFEQLVNTSERFRRMVELQEI